MPTRDLSHGPDPIQAPLVLELSCTVTLLLLKLKLEIIDQKVYYWTAHYINSSTTNLPITQSFINNTK
jgi:hypothetical protein